MPRFLIWAAPLLAVAAPAMAQQVSTDTAAASPAPAPAAAPAKPKKVCRTQQITGRRIAQTQCYTAAQWAEYDRTNQEAAQKLVNDVGARGLKNTFDSNGGAALGTNAIFGIGPPQ